MSLPSVRVVTLPELIVGVAADFAVSSEAVLLMVVEAVEDEDVVVLPFGCSPDALALLVTAFISPAELFTSVWLRT